MSLRSWLERKAAEKAEARLAEQFNTPEKAQAYAERALEGPMNPWLHSLLVAAIGGAATSVVQVLADPSVLFAPGGLKRLGATALAGALVAIVAFLKQSPVPPGSVKQALTSERMGPGGFLILLPLLLGAPAHAQDVPVVPAPEPLPLWTATLDSGTSAVLTRGEKREFVTARVGFAARLSDVFGAFARLDVAGDQDGGGLNLTDPHTFRSIDAAAGFRRITGPLRLSILGGVTYSIEGDQGKPIDARLFTLAGLVGRVVGEGGYVEIGAGHHGPVGGPALLASAQIPVSSGAFTVIDLAFPLQRNVLSEKAWVLKIGASVRVKQLHGGRSGPAPVAPAVKPANAGELVQPDPAAVPEGSLLAEKHGAR